MEKVMKDIKNGFKDIGNAIKTILKTMLEGVKNLYKIGSISEKVFNVLIGLINLFLKILNFMLRTFNDKWLYVPFLTLLILFVKVAGRMTQQNTFNNIQYDLTAIKNEIVKQ